MASSAQNQRKGTWEYSANIIHSCSQLFILKISISYLSTGNIGNISLYFPVVNRLSKRTAYIYARTRGTCSLCSPTRPKSLTGMLIRRGTCGSKAPRMFPDVAHMLPNVLLCVAPRKREVAELNQSPVTSTRLSDWLPREHGRRRCRAPPPDHLGGQATCKFAPRNHWLCLSSFEFGGTLFAEKLRKKWEDEVSHLSVSC